MLKKHVTYDARSTNSSLAYALGSAGATIARGNRGYTVKLSVVAGAGAGWDCCVRSNAMAAGSSVPRAIA